MVFLSAVWTLILTAPIYLRGFIGDSNDIMLDLLNSKSVSMMKQTHLLSNFGVNYCF